MSYIKERIARKRAESAQYKAAYEEEQALLAQELARRAASATVTTPVVDAKGAGKAVVRGKKTAAAQG